MLKIRGMLVKVGGERHRVIRDYGIVGRRAGRREEHVGSRGRSSLGGDRFDIYHSKYSIDH